MSAGRRSLACELGAHAFVGQKHLNLSDSIGGILEMRCSSPHQSTTAPAAAARQAEPAKVVHPTLYGTYQRTGGLCTFDTALTQDYVGEVVMIEPVLRMAPPSQKRWSVRAVVALRRWNVRILGADTNKYDRVAGLTSGRRAGAPACARSRRTAAKPG